MTEPFIIDAHMHIDPPGAFFSPEYDLGHYLHRMDQLGIERAVCVDHLSIIEASQGGPEKLAEGFEHSSGRVFFFGVFNPSAPVRSVEVLEQAASLPGFAGLKIHPTWHRTAAEDPLYESAWGFAAEHGVPILAHSWSRSDYNPPQALSTPDRFEGYVRRFPGVTLLLGHAGGRGAGRHDAVRMARDYENVYLDFAGDIYCYRLIEQLVQSVPIEKILFGSDFPWLDPRSNLSRVLMSPITEEQKLKIVRQNALQVFNLGERDADD